MTDKNQISPSVSTDGVGVVCPPSGAIDPEFSKRITALRFVLSCLVVFIHIEVTKVNFTEGTTVMEVPTWVSAILESIKNILARIAVPTFFIISGYLFFAKPKPAALTVKSKLKGVVLPYVLWTVLTILLYYVAQSFEFSKPFFSNPDKIIRNWGIKDYFSAFWGMPPKEDDGMIMPLVFPLWYVRDLIVMMILSPVIAFCARKQSFAYFVFVTVQFFLPMLGLFRDPYSWPTALFYFSIGYYAVEYIPTAIRMVDSANWRDFLIGYVLSFVWAVFLKINPIKGCGFVVWVNLLFTIALAIKWAGLVAKNEKLYGRLRYLSGFSFWVYAAHAPFLVTVVTKLGMRYFPMSNGVLILTLFFGIFVLCIGILLFIGILLKKYLPRVYALFNGGR